MVLVLVDHDHGQLDELSLQAVTYGRELAASTGEPLDALVVGADGRSVAGALGEHGVTTVHVAVHEGLTDYAPLAWARAASEVATRTGASVVLATGSPRGNEVLAHLGALTDLPVAADCVEVTPGSPTKVVRARWGGSLMEEANLHGSPALVSLVPHTIVADPGGSASGDVAEFTPTFSDADLLVIAKPAAAAEESSGVSLADAKVIISGGRGVGSAEGFAPLEELAELLGGTIGCSRVVTGNGWRPHTEQVGQTGTKVAPDLYIACGISGATQHIAGCRNAKTMIVINTDPEAAIMGYADYAIIGDIGKVLPAIIEETRKAKAG
ncbi:MAG: electron transfer flavoprotein subunit alpha/FixB family protein [Actinomycetia bacterium]|nr:electron transfer flavoprotein subunit alpha/FixB family protein [Actinomycetes bacterium]